MKCIFNVCFQIESFATNKHDINIEIKPCNPDSNATIIMTLFRCQVLIIYNDFYIALSRNALQINTVFLTVEGLV